MASAVRRCHEAGVRVHVVTGDNGATAAAIAREVGIGVPRLEVVATSESLDDGEPDRLLVEDDAEIVFARSSPETKLKIADTLRAHGRIVAMTGDGVNDAPALHRAHIGVAMGRSGTDVAREAAAMVLTDDDFATIVTAIESGRRVYDNVPKFIVYIYVLWRAGWQPGDPTDKGTPLHGAYVTATTATFAGIVSCQVGTAFAARTDHAALREIEVLSDPLLLAGIAFELCFTAALVYAPPLQQLFGTAPLPWDVVRFIGTFPLLVWGVDEARRARRRQRDFSAGAGSSPPWSRRKGG